MRNLKRALSLAVASVMLLGMMVVGSGAVSYDDVTSEHNQEAIDVLQAIGVMVGDGESFNPDQNVTREEMAVIMCQLLDYTVSSYQGLTRFTDVSDWARPYVEACYTNGIIAGYSDTQFGGADSVTTGQAGLMIMKALGYFQEMGDFGSDWLVATVREGSRIHLFEGVTNGASEALTRNDVAQMVLNALQAEVVEILDHDLTSDGNGNLATKAVYTARDKVGSWDTIDDVDTNSPGLQLGEELFEGTLALREAADDMGRPAMEWRYNNQEIGTYADTSILKATYTAKVNKGDLYSLVGSTVVNELTNAVEDVDPSNDTTLDNTMLTVYVDGERLVNPPVSNYFVRNSSAAAGAHGDNYGTGLTGNGVLTEVYMDNQDHVTIVMTSTYLLRATSDYNETRGLVTVETVDINTDTWSTAENTGLKMPSLPATIEQEDFDVANVREGDYLLVTWSYMSDDLVTVEPAEVLVGTVSEYTVTDNVVIDGNKYSYNRLTGTNEKSEEFSINSDASVVLDAYGNIIYVDDAVSTNSFVYIQEFGSTSSLGVRALARAYFADGVSDEITVDKVDDIDSSSDISKWGTGVNHTRWYTYTKNSDGTYNLNSINNEGVGSARRYYNYAFSGAITEDTTIISNDQVAFLNGMQPFAYGDRAVYGDEDTIFVLIDTDDTVNVYTGIINAPEVILQNGTGVQAGDVKVAWVEDADDYAQFVLIDLSNLASNQVVVNDSTEEDFIFVLKQNAGNNQTVVDGATYYQYTVIDTDGTINTSKYIDSRSIMEVGQLYTNIRENSDGYITGCDEVKQATSSDQEKWEMDGTVTMTQSGRTLAFSNGSIGQFVAPTDANLNLIVGKGVEKLLRDKGADYETYLNTTPGTIGGLLSGYYLSGNVYAVVEENGSDVLTTLFIYIDGVQPVAGTTVAARPIVDDAEGNKYEYTYAESNDAKQLTFNVTNAGGANIGDLTYTVTKPDGSTTTAAQVPNGGTITIYPTSDVASAGQVVKGDYVVTVTNTVAVKGGKPVISVGTYEFTVEIGDAELSGYTVTPPYQGVDEGYYVGQTVDLNGLIVEANYENGKKVELTADQYTAVVSGTDSLRLTTYSPTVTINVSVDGVVVGNFEVKMKARTSSEIQITDQSASTISGTTSVLTTITAQATATNGGAVTENSKLLIEYSTDNGNSWTNYSGTYSFITAAVDEDGKVTITIAAGQDYSGVIGRQYRITVAGVAENEATPATSGYITLTVVAAS